MTSNSALRSTIKLYLLLLIQPSKVFALWTCANNVTDFPIDIERLAGTWYEVVRIPDVAVPACVKVIAPSIVTSNNSYDLSINFINNVNSGWQNETETLHFPWSTQVSKGLFELTYGSGAETITITYRLAITDYSNIAAVCGYASIFSAGSFVKILTRERTLNASTTKQIETLVNQYGEGVSLGWVDQSERCNAAERIAPFLAVIMALLYIFAWRV